MQQKVRDKEQMLEWPEHEKAREIQRLRTSLAAHERQQATRDVLCSSLADEAEQLRGQLGATVRVCEELLGRLEKQKNLPAIVEVNEVCVCYRTIYIYITKMQNCRIFLTGLMHFPAQVHL